MPANSKNTLEETLQLAVAFHRCAEVGDLESVKNMAAAGCPVDVRDAENCTALMAACGNGREKVAEWLVQNSADVDAFDERGRSAAMYAANLGSAECLRVLVAAGCDVDKIDINNAWSRAPLAWALNYFTQAPQAGRRSCVAILLEAGCDLGVLAINGKPAALEVKQAAWDRENGWAEIVAMIEAERDRRALEAAAGPGSDAVAGTVLRV